MQPALNTKKRELYKNIRFHILLLLICSLLPTLQVKAQEADLGKVGELCLPSDWSNSICKEGLNVGSVSSRYGYIDESSTFVVEAKYRGARNFSEGLAAVKDQNSKWGFIDRTGVLLIQLQFDDVCDFSEGFAKVEQNGEWGVIGKTGVVLISPQFDKLRDFMKGFAKFEISKKWGVVARDGRIITPLLYNDVGEFREGFCAVQIGEKWGYIDLQGKLVIAAKYDSAAPFLNLGIARVEKGLMALNINKEGRVLSQRPISTLFGPGKSREISGMSLGLLIDAARDKLVLLRKARDIRLKQSRVQCKKGKETPDLNCVKNTNKPFSVDIDVSVVTASTSISKAVSKNIVLDIANNVVMKLALVPVGRFQMGDKGLYANTDEAPVHEVNISKTFYMGISEVTQEQYQVVMGSNPSRFKGAKLPVETVNWHNAIEFCKKLSKTSGRTVRLPSEAEWEYTCRAGSKFNHRYVLLKDYAWYIHNSRKTHPVMQKKPNAWGCYDMLGNVWEWCLDQSQEHWNSNYVGAPIDGSAWIRTKSKTRILRGGSWCDPSSYTTRHTNRFSSDPSYKNAGRGFRIVVEASQDCRQ